MASTLWDVCVHALGTVLYIININHIDHTSPQHCVPAHHLECAPATHPCTPGLLSARRGRAHARSRHTHALFTHRRSRRERRQLPPRLRPSVSGGGQHHFWLCGVYFYYALVVRSRQQQNSAPALVCARLALRPARSAAFVLRARPLARSVALAHGSVWMTCCSHACPCAC